MYIEWQYLLISRANVFEFQSSPRKREIAVPHSARVLSLQVEEAAFGSNQLASDLTRGSHRSTNISKRDRISVSALFQSFLLPGLNALVFSLPAVDLTQTRSMNREDILFELLNWKSSIDRGSEVCQRSLSTAEGPLLTSLYFSFTKLRVFQIWLLSKQGIAHSRGRAPFTKKKERRKEENTLNTAQLAQDWLLEVPLSPS